MELWGFENQYFLGFGPSSTLEIKGAKGAGGGAKRATDAAEKEEVIPDQQDPIDVPKDQGTERLSKVGFQQDVWVEFHGAEDKGKLLSNPGNKKPNALWRYKLSFTERDGKAGVTSREEADEVRKQVEGLPYYDGLKKKDGSPQVSYLTPDGTADLDGDRTPDGVTEGLSDIESRSEKGPDNEGKFEDNSQPLYGAEYGKSLRQRLKDLDDKDKQLDFMILQLIAALMRGGDFLVQLLDLMGIKGKNEQARIAGIVGQARIEIGEKNKDLNKKLVELLGAKGKDIEHGKIQDIRFTLDQNNALLGDTFIGMIRDLKDAEQRDSELASSVRRIKEAISQTWTSWR